MAQTLRAVMVGCGGISNAWGKATLEIDDLDLVGFVDLRELAAAGRAEEFGTPDALVSTDLESTLEKLQPDIVFNCTVPEVHAETAQMALRHGAHVLVEKPLSSSMESARAMIATAEAEGKMLAVMQNRRYNPYIRRLRGLLDSGQIGPLTSLHSDFFIGAHFGGFRDEMAHVLLLDMAIHTFDAARFLSRADPVAVYCHEWNMAGSWYAQDASAVAIFEMSNGIVYNYRGSWSAEGLRTSWESHWRITGTKGSARWHDDEHLEAQSTTPSDSLIYTPVDLDFPAEVPLEHTGGHTGCIREFVQAVRSGATPETVATDNIKSLAMVFGAIESAQRKARVEIH